MVIKGKQIRLQKVDDLDAAHNHKHSTPISCDELLGYENLLLEDGIDMDYKDFLLSIYPEQKREESNRKLRLKDEEHDYNFYHEEEEEEKDDPEYVHILEKLKVHEKSYRIEFEEDGSSVVIKYEGASSSDTECDQELRRKLRSAMKQKDGLSNQMPRAENQGILDSDYTPSTKIKRLTWRQKRSESKSEREENARLSAEKNVPHSTYRHSTPTPIGDSSLDKDCGQEYRRMLRSSTKQNNEHFNRMRDVCKADSQSTPTKEMEKLTRTNLRNNKSEKEDDIVELDPVCHTFSQNLKSSRIKSKSENDEDIIQLDPDYHILSQNLKLVNGRYVYMARGNVIVYDLKSGECIQVKEEHDDESSSDVEIIDSTAFYKVGNLKFSRINYLRNISSYSYIID